ncbi:MAG: hypothetical protein C5B59_04470 [Bacteroidetes bacterium]|nr:MAG: hypothetical protein C5B59_04470 [Bacteroidota bacterium]
MEKKVTSHITKGLIISLILFVLDIIAGFAGLKYANWYKWVPAIIMFALLIWVCASYASQMNNNVTFGSVFGHGFKTSAVIACLTVIFTLLSIFVIFPETKDIALDQARKQMEAKGQLSEDQIDKSIDITKRLFVPLAIIGIIVFTLLEGVVASLIGAAIVKKNPPTFENQ